jgi:hypothetical protein
VQKYPGVPEVPDYPRTEADTLAAIAAYSAPAPALGPSWSLAADGSHWRAELPDGRTAVIRRKVGPDGEGSLLYVPAVHESAGDFVTGPECDGVLAAAHWVNEQVQVNG